MSVWAGITQSVYRLSYGLADRGAESQQGQEIFIFSIESRPALEPTHPPIQWEPGALSPGVELQKLEADDSVPLVSRLRMVELYLHSPICLHGLVLSYIIKCKENFTFMTSSVCKGPIPSMVSSPKAMSRPVLVPTQPPL
jgi:hypothetical protein